MMSSAKSVVAEGASVENSVLDTGPKVRRRVLTLAEIPALGHRLTITMRNEGLPNHAMPAFHIIPPDRSYLVSLGALYTYDYYAPEPRPGVYGLSCFAVANGWVNGEIRGSSGQYPMITPPGDTTRIRGISDWVDTEPFDLIFNFSAGGVYTGSVRYGDETISTPATGGNPMTFPMNFPVTVRFGYFDPEEMLIPELLPYLSFTSNDAFMTTAGSEVLSAVVSAM